MSILLLYSGRSGAVLVALVRVSVGVTISMAISVGVAVVVVLVMRVVMMMVMLMVSGGHGALVRRRRQQRQFAVEEVERARPHRSLMQLQQVRKQVARKAHAGLTRQQRWQMVDGDHVELRGRLDDLQHGRVQCGAARVDGQRVEGIGGIAADVDHNTEPTRLLQQLGVDKRRNRAA